MKNFTYYLIRHGTGCIVAGICSCIGHMIGNKITKSVEKEEKKRKIGFV